MKILVRSQNERMLETCDNFHALSCKGDLHGGYKIISYVGESKEFVKTLGYYPTKQRCIEILEDLQRFIENPLNGHLVFRFQKK